MVVEDGDLAAVIQKDQNSCFAEGVGRAGGIDLVNCFLKLKGEIFRKGTGFLPGENEVEVFMRGERTVNILWAEWFNSEAVVEILDERGEEGVALFHAGYAA